MANGVGISFSPTGDQNGTTRRRRPEDIQRAIQILNLRLPRFEGARSIAPLALLSGPPSIGGLQPLGASVMSLAQQLAAVPQASPPPTTAGLAGPLPRPQQPQSRMPSPGPSPIQPRVREDSQRLASQASSFSASPPLPRISFEDTRPQVPINRTSPPAPTGQPMRRQTPVVPTQPVIRLEDILQMLPQPFNPLSDFQRL